MDGDLPFKPRILLRADSLGGIYQGYAVPKQAKTQPTDPLLPTLAVMSSLIVVKFGVVSYGSNCPETE
jgi:hypothetical protein